MKQHLSGLWLWWPTQWKHLKARLTVKQGVSLKRRLYDLHNVSGIYLYVILFIITFSGVVKGFNKVARRGGIRSALRGIEKKEKKDTKEKTASKPDIHPGSAGGLIIDQIAVLARQAHPHYALGSITLPKKEDTVFKVDYIRNIGIEKKASVSIQAYSGTVNPEEPGPFDIIRLNKSLHEANLGGWVTKVLYSIAGLMPLCLFITGVWAWGLKKFFRKRSRRAS